MCDSFPSPDEQTFTSEEDIYKYFTPFLNFNISKKLERHRNLSKVFTNTIIKYRDEHFDKLLLCKTEQEIDETITKLHKLWEDNVFTTMELYSDLMRRKLNLMIQYRLNNYNDTSSYPNTSHLTLPHVSYNTELETYDYSITPYFLSIDDINTHFDNQKTHTTSKNKNGRLMSHGELEFWRKSAIHYYLLNNIDTSPMFDNGFLPDTHKGSCQSHLSTT